MSRIDRDETAFGGRDGLCSININAVWSDPLESDEHIRWTHEFFASTEPFSTGGVYVNFLGNEGEKRVRAAYGEAKYKRLTALKNKYDPTNLFSLNQNIKPGKRKRKGADCILMLILYISYKRKKLGGALDW
ncbi:Mitomycin radical oxidase [Methanosarcinales archaeon]|nr:BBE domain-containing protein [Candidatus Methanoperedens sp.]CAG0963227.1 Mitomycin radical oxidase [Methanosarcinales archaeon]